MSDLNKKDIDFLISILSVIENFILNGFKMYNDAKRDEEVPRDANMVKTKLYRMKDGIDIEDELKKVDKK